MIDKNIRRLIADQTQKWIKELAKVIFILVVSPTCSLRPFPTKCEIVHYQTEEFFDPPGLSKLFVSFFPFTIAYPSQKQVVFFKTSLFKLDPTSFFLNLIVSKLATSIFLNFIFTRASNNSSPQRFYDKNRVSLKYRDGYTDISSLQSYKMKIQQNHKGISTFLLSFHFSLAFYSALGPFETRAASLCFIHP